MYNRYIPQPDGSFRRSHQPDRVPSRQDIPKPSPKPSPQPDPPCPAPAPPCHPEPPKAEYPQRRPEPPCRTQGQSLGQFFRQLLPKNFDTADLLIVLLLLLMAGDDQEEQNNALLTLALYLFM